jgi:hypothetical protein
MLFIVAAIADASCSKDSAVTFPETTVMLRLPVM